MYYLKSRYYDPGICRFINADSFASTGDSIIGLNMFVYCYDNPILHRDSCGSIPEKAYYVTSVSSEKKETTTDGDTIYEVVICYNEVEGDPSLGYGDSEDGSVSVEFSITQGGIVQIDNSSLNPLVINSQAIGVRFAEEMLEIVKKDFSEYDYLYGRRATSIYFEMQTHYIASRWNYKPNANITDIGGTDPQKRGYDSNAIAFEQPLRHLDIWWDMLF